jgi:NAD(P)-dependent dehydrogenase (short-subunit alcohol dehydrogenase family)
MFDQAGRRPRKPPTKPRAQFVAAVPFGRLGRAEEIASTALFLASLTSAEILMDSTVALDASVRVICAGRDRMIGCAIGSGAAV